FFLSATAAAGRARVQQEPSATINEGTGAGINCSHPDLAGNMNVQWYRQLPDRAPQHVATGFIGEKLLREPEGRLWVSADRQSSGLWLARPRRGDAAVYYCALGD
ncbi:TVA4 protein, partial [Turnix velox]|nr:TVA4 protein [Turnix velox]